MQKRYYLCKFKSDIILKAAANTEVGAENLDFIPGNVFLGIVAKNYDKFSDPFYVFHSGRVKFLDANVLVESLKDEKITRKPSYKMPLCFCNLKVGDGNYNRLFLSDKEEQNLIKQNKQLKQLRSGYMNEDFFEFKINYNYSQKSAHDKNKRRSKDEAMYGYEALNRGLEFLFSVSADDEKTLDEIENYLLGDKFIGKSKTSEYGRVSIEKTNITDKIDSFTPNDNYTYIYAKSRLALFDEFGNPTVLRSVKDLGLKSGVIDFSKSQIKMGSYLPFNAKKNNREMMRYFIEKGSVIAIKDANSGEIPLFIGKFQNEGYGEILINPKFLSVINSEKDKEFDFSRNSQEINEFKRNTINQEPNELKTNLIAFLKIKKDKEHNNLKLTKKVEEFIKLLPENKITNSQWGAISNFTFTTKEENLLDEIEKFINKGVESSQWQEINHIFKDIYKDDEIIDKNMFIRLLASKGQKEKR